ncbi:MAG: SDR family oxidoreductase [Anaerolineales bacterium]
MILVTGAAGKTGLAVTKALAAKNLPVRAWVRRNHQEEQARAAGAKETISGDLRDPIVIAPALAGINSIYLICPNIHPDEYQVCAKLISAAKTAGVKKIVYHSVMLPAIEEMPHHWQKHHVEQELQSSGLDFTILQPASYTQNVLPYFDEILSEGILRVPYSTQAVFTPVDLGDVAEAAAMVFTESGHLGAVYELAGPEKLSTTQMADEIGRFLMKKVEAETQSLESWQAAARENGLAEYPLDALSKMFSYYDIQGFVGNSLALEEVLGRKSTTFNEFLKRNAK